jgi:hypothetical protein
MRDDSPEAVAHRAADAQRKREERARKKLEAETQATQGELNGAKSFPEYWAAKRPNLTPEQRAGYEARENYVSDVALLMKRYLDNHDLMAIEQLALPEDGRVSLQQLIDAVEEDVKAHGVCESIVLIVDRLWTDDEKDLRERITRKGGATATLLTYGYVTALDGFLYERFYQNFLRPRSRQPRVEIPFYVPLLCSLCNAPPTSVSSATAEAYRRSGKYAYGNCLAKAEKIKNFTREQRGAEHTIFDNFGRVKDQ